MKIIHNNKHVLQCTLVLAQRKMLHADALPPQTESENLLSQVHRHTVSHECLLNVLLCIFMFSDFPFLALLFISFICFCFIQYDVHVFVLGVCGTNS